MRHLLRFVPITGLIAGLFVLCAVQKGNAQGIGLRFGPAFNTDIDLATDVGVSLSADIFWSVDDDGLLYLSLQYAPFGLDKEEATRFIRSQSPVNESQIGGTGPTFLSIMEWARFRLHDELDEPSFNIAGGFGASLVTGTEITIGAGAEEQTLELETVVAMSASLGVGVDYPIVGENLALTGQLDVPVNLFSNAENKGVHIPAVFFSVGIEYRVEP